jgi:hypothetical protein
MSCCGEPKNAGPQQGNGMAKDFNPSPSMPMTQQPGSQPPLQNTQYQQFQQPNLQSPPNAYTQNTANGYASPPLPQQPGQQQPQWNTQQQTQTGTPQPDQTQQQPQFNPYNHMQQQSSMGTDSYTPLLDPNIVRPSPVYAASNRAESTSPPISSPPPGSMSMSMSMSGAMPTQNSSVFSNSADEGKMSVSIDFGQFSHIVLLFLLSILISTGLTGTTFSGVVSTILLTSFHVHPKQDSFFSPFRKAYGSSRIAGGKVQQILHWPGSFETFRKIPTCLLYDEHGRVLAWGLEAKNASPIPGSIRCEWCAMTILLQDLR